MKHGPFVSSAMRDLGLSLDARGLVPLAEARRRVRAAKAFERGKSHVVPNQVSRPTDADYLWAALLSLESAAEFVREASRIVWRFPARGFDNVAPRERYGDAILPWLAHLVDNPGRRAPERFVLACLAGIGSEAALEVLLRVRPGAGDDPREPVRAWLAEHGRRGWKALGDLAGAGHAGANEVVVSEVTRSSAATRRSLVAAIGASKAKALLAGRSTELTEAAILDVLDRAASSMSDHPLPWPSRGASVGHFEPHAMRVIAARARRGDDWGLLFEVVQGDVLEGPDDELRWPATIQQYRYGSRVPAGGRYLVDARPIGMHRVLPRGGGRQAFAVPASFDGVKVVGPKATKPFSLTDALVKELRLEPGRACSPRIEDWPSVIALRARLARDPDAFWTDPEAIARKTLAIKDPIVVVATDEFEHVSGPAAGARGKDARLPSATKTFRSIAAAIVHRDPERFDRGLANIGWRRSGARSRR